MRFQVGDTVHLSGTIVAIRDESVSIKATIRVRVCFRETAGFSHIIDLDVDEDKIACHAALRDMESSKDRGTGTETMP